MFCPDKAKSKLITLCILCNLLIAFEVLATDQPYGDLKLLEGYKYRRSATIDTVNGFIYKEGGLNIEFESGISEGYAVNSKDKNKYIWYREQIIKGNKVMVALAKPGVGTVWKPDKPRKLRSRQILMVTFPGRFGPDDAANFYAEVQNEQEIADMLLMVLTFDPSK